MLTGCLTRHESNRNWRGLVGVSVMAQVSCYEGLWDMCRRNSCLAVWEALHCWSLVVCARAHVHVQCAWLFQCGDWTWFWVSTWTTWGHLHSSWEGTVDRRTPGQADLGCSVVSEETFLSARHGCIYFRGVFLSLNQPVRSANRKGSGWAIFYTLVVSVICSHL